MRDFLQKIKEVLLWSGAMLIGILPEFILYLLADCLYIILHRVVKYRLTVVRDNLRHSFRSYSDEKLKDIEVKFYKHLADIMVETIAIASFNREKIESRMVYRNMDDLKKVMSGKVGLLVSAHYGSWEHTIGMSLTYKSKFYGVYHPLTSKSVDNFFLKCRYRFGATPLTMADVAKSIVMDVRSKTPALYGLIADQTPPRPHIKKWIMFLGQPTPFVMGPEKLAVKFKTPITFLTIRKIKRGYYETLFVPIYDGVEVLPEYEITKRYAKALESMIVKEPHLWMWSHRRWKHHPQSAEDII